MANRVRSRSAIRNDRDRDRLNASIDRGDTPEARGQSQVVRIDNIVLTNAQGNLNARGQLFETLVNERAILPKPRSMYTTDPFKRGTWTEGVTRSLLVVQDRRFGLVNS